ncbi:MAG: hypothetical protein AAFX65_00615 [Cyanobacteria bacterium J06638_7]
MRIQLSAFLLLPLLAGALTSPVLAGSRTSEGISHSLAAGRSMQGVPDNAGNQTTSCTSFGPTTHYRCTTRWSK